MADIFRNILGMTLTGGLLTLLALAVLPATKKALPPKWHCYLLSAILAFFLLPIGTTSAALFEKVIHAALFVRESNLAEIWDEIPAPLAMTMNPQMQRTSETITILEAVLPFLPIVWMIGMMVSLIFKFSQLARFEKLLAKSNEQITDNAILDAFERVKKELQISDSVSLWRNACISTPTLIGLIHTRLLIPRIELSGTELELVLRHELTHHRNRDLWVKYAAMLARAIHWFNPCIYLLSNSLERFSEMACDADVVKEMDRDQRRVYGAAILTILNRSAFKQPSVYAAFSSNKKEMKGRLFAMLNGRKQSKKVVVFSILVFVFICMIGIGVSAAVHGETEALPPLTHAGTEPEVAAYTPANAAEPNSNAEDESGIPNPLDFQEGTLPVFHSFLWPTLDGWVSVGLNGYEGHTGMDIVVPLDTPVYASAPGIVVLSKSENQIGYGKYIVIDHGDGYQTLYAHCNSLDVSVGDTVEAGQTIATAGRSGAATGVNLHFEIRRNGECLNPEEYVNADNIPMQLTQS